MLSLKDVTRTSGGVSLSGVSLQAAPGRPTAIVGLSATGREALARLISGADRPQAGEIRLAGTEISKARSDKGRIVRVSPLGLASSGQKVGKAASREAAALAGLSGQMEAKLSSLSAVQRMRLALAHAASARPSLLVVDGPTSLLGAEARDALLTDIRALLAPATGVVVLVAASAGEALAVDGDIVVFDRGAIIQTGAVADVSAHPVNLASAIATSWPQLNTLPMTAKDGRGQLADGARLQLPEEIVLPAEGACTLAFHPEDVTLERASPGCLRFVVRAAGDAAGGFLPVAFAGSTWLCPMTVAQPHVGALLNAFVDRSKLMLFDGGGKALN
jgi:ABC-type sugar transport system ATPase subunit